MRITITESFETPDGSKYAAGKSYEIEAATARNLIAAGKAHKSTPAKGKTVEETNDER